MRLQPGYVVENKDGRLALVIRERESGQVSVTFTGHSRDAAEVTSEDLSQVFPPDVVKANTLQNFKRATHKTNSDPRMTNDLLDIGGLLDLALEVENAWPNGREIYNLLATFYDDIRHSNFDEFGPRG